MGRYFEIDELSGQLTVRFQGDAILDRDIEGGETHDIHINIQDNYQGNGSMSGFIIHRLLATLLTIHRFQEQTQITRC